MYIDIGSTSKEDAEKYIGIGDCAAFIGEYHSINEDIVMSKALDDRAGCHIMIEALKKIKNNQHDLYFVFTVQEEVGLRGGATVAAEQIRPDLGIALDITGSFDIPGDEYGHAVIGGGAAIKMADASVLCDQVLVEAMIDCAKREGIPYQLDVLKNGGTDAGAINRSRYGVKSLGISIPTRYGHSPSSMVSLKDIDACIRLLKSFLEEPIRVETRRVIK